MLITLLACAACSYWYNTSFVTPSAFSWRGIIYMYMYSVAIGIPVCTIFSLAKYIYAGRQPLEKISAGIETAPGTIYAANLIRLQATAGNDVLEFTEENFLFASAEGNYCNIYYINNGQTCKSLIRIPLKIVEEQISNSRIVRCHRSFIVNLDKVTDAKGNAQGYRLSLQDMAEAVPVSRKYLPYALLFSNQS